MNFEGRKFEASCASLLIHGRFGGIPLFSKLYFTVVLVDLLSYSKITRSFWWKRFFLPLLFTVILVEFEL
jgi:hypothetical protein